METGTRFIVNNLLIYLLDPLTWKGLAQWYKHTITFSSATEESRQRAIQYTNDQPPVVAVSPVTAKNMRTLKTLPATFHLKDKFSLPEGVKLLVKTNCKCSFVVWFHNFNENKSVQIDTSFFKNVAPKAKSYTLTEVSLTANQLKAEAVAKRLNWSTNKIDSNALINKDYLQGNYTFVIFWLIINFCEPDGTINLRPLEIRTFQIDIEW